MLLLVLQWSLISLIGLAFGELLLSASHKVLNVNSNKPLPTLFVFLLGLSVITFLGNVWSLSTAIGLAFQLLLVVVTGIHLIRNRSIFQRIKSINYLLVLPLVVITIVLALHPTTNVDEAGYYLPQVKWIESYPVVKGTALFIARLGFNSALHMLSAIFGYSSLYLGGIYEVNGLLFVWFNYYFFSAGIRILRSNSASILSDALLTAALVFPFSFLIDAMDSDYLVTMGSIVIIAKMIEEFKEKSAPELINVLAYLLITILLVQTKPFAALVCLAPLLLLSNSRCSYVTKGIIVLCCGVAISPWLIRNVLISGYLVFPAYYLDLFDCAWKIPLDMAHASLDIIEEHAKVQSIRLDYRLEGIEKLKISEWLPTWLAFQKEQLIGWFFIIMGPISCTLWLASGTAIYFKKIKFRVELYFLFFSFIVILFWFFNFPAIRFGWSWIITFITVSSILFVQIFLAKWIRTFLLCLLVVASLSWIRLGYNTLYRSADLTTKLLVPTRTIISIDHTIITSGKTETKVARNPYCHGTHPPCQPHNNQYQITSIGPKVKDGFRTNKSIE